MGCGFCWTLNPKAIVAIHYLPHPSSSLHFPLLLACTWAGLHGLLGTVTQTFITDKSVLLVTLVSQALVSINVWQLDHQAQEQQDMSQWISLIHCSSNSSSAANRVNHSQPSVDPMIVMISSSEEPCTLCPGGSVHPTPTEGSRIANLAI